MRCNWLRRAKGRRARLSSNASSDLAMPGHRPPLPLVLYALVAFLAVSMLHARAPHSGFSSAAANGAASRQ